jgi:hypothetical protein
MTNMRTDFSGPAMISRELPQKRSNDELLCERSEMASDDLNAGEVYQNATDRWREILSNDGNPAKSRGIEEFLNGSLPPLQRRSSEVIRWQRGCSRIQWLASFATRVGLDAPGPYEAGASGHLPQSQ